MILNLLIWHLLKEQLFGKIAYWQLFSCLNTLFEELTRCYVTSHWHQWVVHESIHDETVESPTPSCTLRIFYPSHFPHSAFSTLRILHTPHFPISPFSTLRKFYTQHSTYFTEPYSRYNFPHLSICSALKSTTENNEKLSSGSAGSLSRVYAQHYIGKGFLLWSKSKIKCVHYRWPRRNDKLCTRLFSRATNTSVLLNRGH